MVNISDFDRARAIESQVSYGGSFGQLRFDFGSSIGQGVLHPGDVGGPGGPPPPATGGVPVAAPFAGSGWEVRVLAAPGYNILLAVIPGKILEQFSFVKQLKDKGSGTITLLLDDPFWNITLPNAQPGHYLLDYEHLWQVFQDGVCRFEFFGETVTEQLADNSEQRVATIAGPGTIAALGWAIAAPPGFPSAVKYKLDALADGFSAVDVNGNFVVDYGLWNAASNTADISINPSGSVRLTGHPSTSTILGTTAYDATSTLASVSVAPIVTPNAAGATLDGSQVTQFYIQDLGNAANYALIGVSGTAFYAQYSDSGGVQTKTIASLTQFNAAAAATNPYQYWQISENNGAFFFWTSADGQTWAQQWTVKHANWDALNVGLYMSAKYDVDNTQWATFSALNSNITTSSLSGPLYFNKPIIGGIWLDLLAKAKTRGTIPFMTTGALSLATDSFGNPWNDTQSVQIQNGTDLFALLQAHASMINADWIMQPGFRLQVGIPSATKITLGFDRSNTVVFRDGEDCTAKVRTRARNSILNILGVINADGRTLVATDSSSTALYGQREGWLQAAMQVSQADLAVVATAADLENANEVLSYSLSVSPFRPGRTVFTGYDVGDWVGLERPDFSAIDKVRISAIAVQVDNTGAETHELTLVTYIQWLTEQLTYIATKMGGGFVGAAGTSVIPNNAQLTNLNTPTIANPTLPGLGGVLAGGPNANAPLVFDPNTGLWVPAGTIFTDTGGVANVIVQGSGGQVVIDGSGSSVTVQNVPTAPPDGPGNPVPTGGIKMGVSSTIITDAAGVSRVVIGAQPDGSFGATAAGAPPPNTPDTPTVSNTLQGILVAWDGLLAAANPLSDFLWCEVHVSTSSGFTPSPATLKGTLVSASVFPVVGLVVGTTYYVKLVGRNTSGVASTPSVQGSGVPSGLSASTIGQLGVLNANPYFAGADGSTWTGFNGTFAVSSSPPAGTPYANAGFFTITTAAAGAAGEEAGQPFRVAANQPYLVTAWVYSSNTSAVVGFDWQNSSHVYISTSTQTFTVTANTWTLVTTVQTSPGTAVWAYPRLAPADGVGNTIYFTAVLCFPSVPGGLIQAGTITASQIAAATITAAQIAANTITSNEILANTITASDIAANTITASQIATGTITAGLLAAGIIKAGIVDGTSISAATFIAYGTNGEVLIYAGTPAAGNLLMTVSPSTGSDSFGNDWDQGVQLTALAGLSNLFSVVNTSGDTLAAIDDAGNISAAVIAGDDVTAGGTSVLDYMTEAPQGLIARGWTPAPWPTVAVGATEKAILELDFTALAGRRYEIQVLPCDFLMTSPGAVTQFVQRLKYTADGTTPSITVGGSVIEAPNSPSIVEADNSAHNNMTPFMDWVVPLSGSDVLYRFMTTIAVQAGTAKLQNNLEMRVIDLGLDGPEFADSGVHLDGTSVGGSGGVQTYNRTFYATATHSYYGVTGSLGSGNNGKRTDNSTCYQGCPSGGALTYGDQHSYINFDYTTIAAYLAGSTVNSVKLRLTNLFSGYASGTYAIVGYTTYTGTFGDPFIPGAGTHFFQNYYGYAKGATTTINITSWAATAFKTGGAAAICLGRSADRTTGTDLTNYGGYFGYSASNHTNCPALTINYTK